MPAVLGRHEDSHGTPGGVPGEVAGCRSISWGRGDSRSNARQQPGRYPGSPPPGPMCHREGIPGQRPRVEMLGPNNSGSYKWCRAPLKSAPRTNYNTIS